jgi:hypothetical protein
MDAGSTTALETSRPKLLTAGNGAVIDADETGSSTRGEIGKRSAANFKN